MGGVILFLLVLYAVYLDAKTLRRENAGIYERILALKPWQWTFLNTFFFLIVIPMYFYLRRRYFSLLALQRKLSNQAEYRSPAFLVLTECTGIVISWFFFVNCLHLVYAAAAFFLEALRTELLQFVVLSLASHGLVIFLIWRTVRRNHREGFLSYVRFKAVDKFFLQNILAPLLIGVVLAGGSFLVSENLDTTVITPLGLALSEATPVAMLAFLFSVMFIAPLIEEIIYRGYLYSILDKLKGKLFALIFVSLLFGLMHIEQVWGSWFGLAVIFLMGFLVTLLRFWSGSILPGVIAHYAYNILLVVLPVTFFYFSNPAYAKYHALGTRLSVSEQEELLQESIRIKPDYSVAYNDLAWIYATQDKELQEALRLVDTALSLDPDNPSYLDTKAEVLYKLGDYNQAIEIESKLAEQHPDDALFQQQLDKFKAGLEAVAPNL